MLFKGQLYFQKYTIKWKTGQIRVTGKKDPNLYVPHVEDTAGVHGHPVLLCPTPSPPGERHTPWLSRQAWP